MVRVEELRQRAEKEREQGCGRGGKGYSEAFRKDAAKCVLAELENGVRRTRIAKGMGVGWSTIEQWLPKTNKRKPRKLFRRLSVTKSQATDARDRVGVEGATSTRIVVTSSSGLMIEGLTVLDLSELLRRFGC
jgi:transposase-like protein